MKLAMAPDSSAMEEGEIKRREELRAQRERAARTKSRADLRRRLGRTLRSLCLWSLMLAAVLVFAQNYGWLQAYTGQFTKHAAPRTSGTSVFKLGALTHQQEINDILKKSVAPTSPPPVVIIIKDSPGPKLPGSTIDKTPGSPR
jgi:hypothetical protein